MTQPALEEAHEIWSRDLSKTGEWNRLFPVVKLCGWHECERVMHRDSWEYGFIWEKEETGKRYAAVFQYIKATSTVLQSPTVERILQELQRKVDEVSLAVHARLVSTGNYPPEALCVQWEEKRPRVITGTFHDRISISAYVSVAIKGLNDIWTDPYEIAQRPPR